MSTRHKFPVVIDISNEPETKAAGVCGSRAAELEEQARVLRAAQKQLLEMAGQRLRMEGK